MKIFWFVQTVLDPTSFLVFPDESIPRCLLLYLCAMRFYLHLPLFIVLVVVPVQSHMRIVHTQAYCEEDFLKDRIPRNVLPPPPQCFPPFSVWYRVGGVPVLQFFLCCHWERFTYRSSISSSAWLLPMNLTNKPISYKIAPKMLFKKCGSCE